MSTEHPDEGTIHAWLDGALDDAESARIAAHVAACASCGAAAAEARGLIAGATRVVRALDDAEPGAAAPGWGRTADAARVDRGTRWRAPRVTPARAVIAASLLVAAGLTLTHDWAAQDSALMPPPASRSATAASTPAPGTPAMSAARPPAARDPLLDSAVRRNVAQALPPRTLERAPGADIPSAPAPNAMVVDSTAGVRVAEGRMAARARADSAPAAADHSSAPLNVATTEAVVEQRAMRRRTTAPAQAIPMRRDVPMPADAASASGAARSSVASTPHAQCYRIESATAGAVWGGVTLPILVRIGGDGPDEGPWRAVAGGVAEGRWRRAGDGSVRLDRGAATVVADMPGTVTAKAAACP